MTQNLKLEALKEITNNRKMIYEYIYISTGKNTDIAFNSRKRLIHLTYVEET